MNNVSNQNASIPPLKEEDHLNRRTLWVLLVGIFLISFSLLTFEISLSRVLSVMLSYHYVFVIISLALLGLGTGGIFVYLFRRQVPQGNNRFTPLALYSSLFSLSLPLSIIVITRIVSGNILLYCLFLYIPFFLVGAFLAEVFRMFPALSSKMYGIDLLGAAVGSLGAVIILNNLGDANTVLVLGTIASIAALLYTIGIAGINIKRITLPVVNFLIIAGLLGANLLGFRLVDIPIDINQEKEIYMALNTPDLQGEIIETKWSAFGRTDLVAFHNDPEQMGIYLDGTAGTPMYRFNGDINNPNPAIASLKSSFPGYLPFSFLQEAERNNALIIGPGGGRDVLLALMGGVGDITAVEVNQDLVDMVDEYAWYNGGIFTDMENVSVYVDEGRNFLKRQEEKYDIIMLSLPVTKTGRSLEGFALTENFLFTTDSIDDYLEHLTDEGRLIVVAHGTQEIMRLLSISLTSLNQKGLNSEAAMEQIYVVGSHHFPVFVLKKTPFEPTEMVSIHQSIHQLRYDATTSYLPSIRIGSCITHMEETRFDECAMLFPPAIALGSGGIDIVDLEKNLQESDIDISPITDDNPFFFKYEKGIPQSVSVVFWISITMLLLVILIPLVYLKKKPSYREVELKNTTGINKNPFRFVVLFTMLGMGFMLVEISAIQRFILFLGQPVLSLAVLLFSLLIGAGIGSVYSTRFASEKIPRVISIVSASIVAVLLIYAFSLSFILNQFLGLDLAVRLLVTGVMLIPLGFIMGFLFPSGLRLLKEMNMEHYIPWMWGINGIGSVLGAAMTIVIATSFGFTEALLFGAACYLVVFLTFLGAGRKQSTAEVGGNVNVEATKF